MTSTQRRALLLATVPLSIGLIGDLPRARAQARRRLIRGAGATFPAPLYQAWIELFEQARPDIDIEYDSVGSGEGVSRLITGSIDFAASDAAMTDEQIAQVTGGVRMIPATAGLISLAYNVEGLDAPLRLPRDVLPAIFAGEIDQWDDPRIAAANPGASLPPRTIALVARLDSSGTTFAFTNFLSALSEGWRAEHGAATRIDWPSRAMLARGNEGVAGRVLQTPDSIGYVEYGFAKRLGIAMAEVQNKMGDFVAPTVDSGQAALMGSADMLPENLRLFIADPPGARAYPIITYSWLLLFGAYRTEEVRVAVADFVRFGLTTGQRLAPNLGYIPLAPAVSRRGLAALETLT